MASVYSENRLRRLEQLGRLAIAFQSQTSTPLGRLLTCPTSCMHRNPSDPTDCSKVSTNRLQRCSVPRKLAISSQKPQNSPSVVTLLSAPCNPSLPKRPKKRPGVGWKGPLEVACCTNASCPMRKTPNTPSASFVIVRVIHVDTSPGDISL